MIIKGGQRGKGRELAAHLIRTDTNETVRLLDRQGVVGNSVKDVLAEMAAVAMGGRSAKPLYHVSLSPEAHERLSDAQWRVAADKLGEALGLSGHQRLIMIHLKAGEDGQLREHAHIVWNRVHPETLKTAHHSHNYRTHEEVARALEREFGLNRTQGVHAERDPEQPKDREKRSKTKDSQQEARTKWPKEAAKTAIGAAWREAEDGAGFRTRLAEQGYRLARGDQRDYVVVDPAGGVHSIRSGVPGLKAADVRARLADLDPNELPSVAEAQRAARAEGRTYRAERTNEDRGRTGTPGGTAAPPPRGPRPRTARPPRPKPGRYDDLAKLSQSKTPNKARAPRLPPPQLVPKPPSWARDEPTPRPAPAPKQPASSPPVRPDRPPPTPPDARHLADLTALVERQRQDWGRTASGIEHRHAQASSALETHHQRRLAEIPVELDQRLAELNSLGSRAGALIDRSARDREIAYLVAVRQRRLAEEKDRQEAVRADLARAQAKELAEARASHERHAAAQRAALERRQASRRASARQRDELEP